MEKCFYLSSLHIIFNAHTWVQQVLPKNNMWDLSDVDGQWKYLENGKVILAQIGRDDKEMVVLDFKKMCITYDTCSLARKVIEDKCWIGHEHKLHLE